MRTGDVVTIASGLESGRHRYMTGTVARIDARCVTVRSEVVGAGRS